MPEIIPGGRETYPDESSLTLLADGSHETFDGFRRHFIKNANHLARQQGSVHYDEGAMGAHKLRESLQIDGFALRHLTSNL